MPELARFFGIVIIVFYDEHNPHISTLLTVIDGIPSGRLKSGSMETS